MRKFSPILQIYQVIYKYLQLNFGAAEQNLKSRREGKLSDGTKCRCFKRRNVTSKFA